MSASRYKFLIVDDHQHFRQGVEKIIVDAFPNAQLAGARNHAEAYALAVQQAWDLLILDINLPGRSGLDLIKDVKMTHKDMPILVLSMHEEGHMALRTLRAGASGYLSKNKAANELISAITKILDGEPATRKTSQKNLKQPIPDLKNLNAYAQKIREDEQLKIARLLHDDLAQLLTSLKMELTMYKEKEGKFNYNGSDSLDTLINLLDQSSNAVTSIITKLRPEILDNMGLIPALEWLFYNFQKRTGIITDFRIKGDYFPENGDNSISIYRVVEEVLNNIRFHSKASNVMIKLSGNYSGFSISIKDNGIGITKEDISNPFSFGIMGMKERITALKGSITFKGIPEKGTSIYIKIPMK